MRVRLDRVLAISENAVVHKYGRDKRPAGYIRPDHLLSQTAVHLKLRFNDGVRVPGRWPLAPGGLRIRSNGRLRRRWFVAIVECQLNAV